MASWDCAACGAGNWASRAVCRCCAHQKTYAQALNGGRKAGSGAPPWSQRNLQGRGIPAAPHRQRDQRARDVPLGGGSSAARRPAAGCHGSVPAPGGGCAGGGNSGGRGGGDHDDPNDINDDGAAPPPAWVPQRNLQRKLDRMLRKRSALDDDLEALEAAAQSMRDQIASLEADTQAVRADMAAAVARAASEVPACSAPVAELEGLPASVRDLPAVQAILAEAAGAIRRIAGAAATAETDGYEEDYEGVAMDMRVGSPGAIYLNMRTPEGRHAARAASQSAAGVGDPVPTPVAFWSEQRRAATPVPTPTRTEAPTTPPGRWNRGGPVPQVGPLPGGGPSGRHGTSPLRPLRSPFAEYAARRGRNRSGSPSRSESPDDGPYARPRRRERGQPTLEQWWTGQCG